MFDPQDIERINELTKQVIAKTLTTDQLRKLPTRLDIYRSTATGELFELIDIDDNGIANVFHIGTMTPGRMKYDTFRTLCIQEPPFIGEDR